MGLKPIDPHQLSNNDVDPGTSGRFTNNAAGMNHYTTQHQYTSPNLRPDSTGTIHTHAAPPNPEEDRRRTLIIVIVVAVLLIALIIGVVVGVTSCTSNNDEELQTEGTVTITIENGYGSGDIAQLLRDAGLVETTTEFIQAVNAAGATDSLQAGTYTIDYGTPVGELVEILITGPGAGDYAVTIPEGFTVEQTAERLAYYLDFTYEEFMEQAKASNYSFDYPFLEYVYDDSLEGYLFPKTYGFAEGVSVDEVIRTMLDQFVTETAGLDWSTAHQGDTYLSEYEVIIMASLIEGEVSLDWERPIVASVIYNRLNIWMPLQIDATIAYALNKYSLLTTEDTEVDSPYNTYTNYGLPPGPICSPSLASIEAVLDPAETDYYYYVASAALDGSHVFSTNYDDHLAAVADFNAATGQ